MKLTKEQWIALDKRMEVLFNEAFHLIDNINDKEEHYNKYIEILERHCEIDDQF